MPARPLLRPVGTTLAGLSCAGEGRGGEARLPEAGVTTSASGKGGGHGAPTLLPAPAPGTPAGSPTMARAAPAVRLLVQARPESGFVPLVDASPDDVSSPIWWPPAVSEACDLGPRGSRAGPLGEQAWWAAGSGGDWLELLSGPCRGPALVSMAGEVSVACAHVATRRHWCCLCSLRPGPRTSGWGCWTGSWAPHGPLTAASGCAVPGRATSSPSWNSRNPSLARWKVCF